jgi:hypothetical protein
MFPTVFNLHGVDRIAEWKTFREQLESSPTPFEDVANLWSQAPFVNPYLDPHRPESWPDPWRLLLDLKLDSLAISLAMLYTLKLTQRFMGTPIEIHMSMLPGEREYRYPVIIDNRYVLNWEYNTVSDLSSMKNIETTLIFSKSGSL